MPSGVTPVLTSHTYDTVVAVVEHVTSNLVRTYDTASIPTPDRTPSITAMIAGYKLAPSSVRREKALRLSMSLLVLIRETCW